MSVNQVYFYLGFCIDNLTNFHAFRLIQHNLVQKYIKNQVTAVCSFYLQLWSICKLWNGLWGTWCDRIHFGRNLDQKGTKTTKSERLCGLRCGLAHPHTSQKRQKKAQHNWCGPLCGHPCPHSSPHPSAEEHPKSQRAFAGEGAATPARTLSLNLAAQSPVRPDQAAPQAAPDLFWQIFVQILCDLRSIRFQISPDYSPSHEFGYIREEAAIWRDHLSFYHSLPSNPNHLLHSSLK